MYWNNSWLNNFNFKNFFSKTLFLENILFYIFSEKIFKIFFEKKISQLETEKLFLKKINKKLFLRKNKIYFTKKKIKKNKIKFNKYNFTKLWFIKYNNYILLTTFLYFFFKIKNKKKYKIKTKPLNKVSLIFWKKRRGSNIKKKIFFSKDYLFF